MANIKKNFTELVGNTPIIEAQNFVKSVNAKARILAKLENMNPGGSAKDRVALSMIEDAENKGLLTAGSVIIEPTSGNTGIGLAAVAVAKGYKLILTMPESMSIERRKLLKAYGADIVLTEASLGMVGAIEKAQELSKKYPNSFIPGQFDNYANPDAHRKTTGPEIWEDTDGNVDIFVATVGTGGTLTGAGEYLKSKNSNIKVIAVEPASSNLLSGGNAAPHKIQGIGANFIPKVLNQSLYDEVICVEDDDAFKYSRLFAKTEGVLVGISAGAALCAATKLSLRPENTGKNIVVILTDTGERYLSTELFD
ncbi:MAG: cysteine synthase A [Clostridia bacterium]|nr:cysteine synthase A [Clostridia bacterium]